jgi:glycosyltransferase involved in cell wall biosynthesis
LSKYRKEKGIFYLNTIIPFGAAWACKILKKNLVYHIHEDMNLHKPLYPIYRYTYYICCQKSIFVSNYLERSSKSKKKSIVVHNALSNEFISLAKENLILKNFIRSNILMVSSLKKAKGIYEFIEISRRLPQYGFELVVNATNQEVETFKTETNLPGNLKIYTQQTDLHSFYQRAKLLFNLSHPDKLIETFGLTILEAMVYGIPSIVPPVGGPTELIIDGFNGFTIDPFNINKLIEKTNILMNNDVMYSRFSDNAQKKSNDFVFEKMINNIENFLLEEYLAK